MKRVAKRFLRWLSEIVVIKGSVIALCGAGSLNRDLRMRLDHFLVPLHIDYIVARRFVLVRKRKLGDFNASSSDPWRFLVALIIGKVAFLNDCVFLKGLQTLLPRKFFILEWRGTFRNSSWRWLEIGTPSRKALMAASQGPLQKPALKHHEAVIILGTGPSAELVFSSFSKDFDIISCNSAVKSRELFQSRSIVAHCFSDATFMLGVSAYSSAFLNRLVERSRDVPLSLVYDAYFTGHLQSRLDPGFAGQLLPIFLDPCNEKQPNFRSTSKQYSYTNVLTALMLPFAATWYQDVYLLGFDGKGATKDYFWQHQDRFQFTELLQTVRECDPGFFAGVDYDAYSAEHERYLSDMLDEVRRSGVIVRSLMRSSSACIDKLFDHDMSRRLREGYQKSN